MVNDSIDGQQKRLRETFLNSDGPTFLTQLRRDSRLDINYVYDQDPFEPLLLTACRNRDAARITLLRDAGADFNARNLFGDQTALLNAASYAHHDVLSLLLAEPTNGQAAERTCLIAPALDLNARDFHDRTALHLLVMAAGQPARQEAAEAGLRLLVGHADIDLDARDENGLTPLRLALELKLVQPVLILAEAGAALPDELRPLLEESDASLRPLVSQLGRPARQRPAYQLLWEAVHQTQTVAAVNAALKRLSEDPDLRRNTLDTPFGRYTCLQWAARESRLEVARLLLKAGASPDAASAVNPQQPLLYAAEHGVVPLLELLLDALRCRTEPLDLMALRDKGPRGLDETALHKAARHGPAPSDADFDRCLSLLLAEDVEVNSTNKDGQTALHHALRSEFESGALLLLEMRGEERRREAGASLAVEDKNGIMPIDMIRPEFLRSILDARVRPLPPSPEKQESVAETNQLKLPHRGSAQAQS